MKALARTTDHKAPQVGQRLRAQLRPQFASPVILVDPADPVMGGPSCAVPSCQRVAVLLGMCTAHRQRWTAAGRPADARAWAATASPARRWLAEPAKCVISSCHRAQREWGLCHSHGVRWCKHGRPDLARWIDDDGRGGLLPRNAQCRFIDCGLDGEGPSGLCYVHRCRWTRNGRPPVDAWVADCAMFGLDRFDLRALPTPMRSEVAYAIQCRVDAPRYASG